MKILRAKSYINKMDGWDGTRWIGTRRDRTGGDGMDGTGRTGECGNLILNLYHSFQSFRKGGRNNENYGRYFKPCSSLMLINLRLFFRGAIYQCFHLAVNHRRC